MLFGMPHMSFARHFSKNLAFAILTTYVMVCFCLRVMVFSTAFVMINNSGTSSLLLSLSLSLFFVFLTRFLCFLRIKLETRATANGVGQTMGAVARLSAPLILCNLFSWSIGNDNPWPFNYCFTWYFQAIVAWTSSAWVHFLLPAGFEDKCRRASEEKKKKKKTKKGKKKKRKKGYATLGGYDDEDDGYSSTSTSSSLGSDETEGSLSLEMVETTTKVKMPPLLDSRFDLFDFSAASLKGDKLLGGVNISDFLPSRSRVVRVRSASKSHTSLSSINEKLGMEMKDVHVENEGYYEEVVDMDGGKYRIGTPGNEESETESDMESTDSKGGL